MEYQYMTASPQPQIGNAVRKMPVSIELFAYALTRPPLHWHFGVLCSNFLDSFICLRQTLLAAAHGCKFVY